MDKKVLKEWATPSRKYRVWFRDKCIKEFDNIADATVYVASVNVALVITTPTEFD